MRPLVAGEFLGIPQLQCQYRNLGKVDPPPKKKKKGGGAELRVHVYVCGFKGGGA